MLSSHLHNYTLIKGRCHTSRMFLGNAHNNIESVGPTLSSLESKMASSKEGSMLGNAIILNENRAPIVV